MATAPKHIGGTAKRVKKSADKGEIVKIPRAPLRSGQRHKGRRARKVRTVTSYTEAPDVQARADVMIGQDAFRLRSLAQAKIAYVFSSADRITGCLDGVVRASRYARLYRFKSALKYEFIVLVSKPRWDMASDEDRTRIAYHGLRHLGSDTVGRWRIDPHDIEGFLTEVEHFGLKNPTIKRVADQLQLWEGKA